MVYAIGAKKSRAILALKSSKDTAALKFRGDKRMNGYYFQNEKRTDILWKSAIWMELKI